MAFDPEQRTLRDMVRRISPSWLQGYNGYRLTYTFAVLMDELLDSCVAAVKHRFPGLYSYEALGIIGSERRLPRGLFETDETYALRLRRWWAAARGRGGPHELIEQLRAFHDPQPTGIQVIYRSGRRWALNAAGEIVMDDVAGWNPNAHPELWATYWVILFTEVYHEAAPEVLQRALQDLKNLVLSFNAAHCLFDVMVVSDIENTELWAALPPPPGEPDTSTWADSGTWASTGEDPLVISS